VTDIKKRDPKELVAEIAEFDALVVRSATKVTAKLSKRAKATSK